MSDKHDIRYARKILGFESINKFKRFLVKIGFIEWTHKGTFSRSKYVIYRDKKKRGQRGHSVDLFITEEGIEKIKEMMSES